MPSSDLPPPLRRGKEELLGVSPYGLPVGPEPREVEAIRGQLEEPWTPERLRDYATEWIDLLRTERRVAVRAWRAVRDVAAEACRKLKLPELREQFLGATDVEDVVDALESAVSQMTQVPVSPSALGATPAAAFVLSRSGNGWFIRAFGEEGHFRNLVGLLYIARLVRSAGKPYPAAALVREPGASRPAVGEAEASAEGLSAGAGRQLVSDEEALAQYRRELDEYDAAIAQAVRDGDMTQAEILQGERQQLLERIQADVGLGGRTRPFGAEADRLRQSVLQALRRAYDALRKANPPLMRTAGHFETFIEYRAGDFIYRPAPPLDWQVSL